MFFRSGRQNCGIVTIRSKPPSGACTCSRCTSLVRPPDCLRIHFATGAARRDAAITRSGHGGSSGADLSRSTVARVAPRRMFGSTFSLLWRSCLISYGQPSASARLCIWPFPPVPLPKRTQTCGGRNVSPRGSEGESVIAGRWPWSAMSGARAARLFRREPFATEKGTHALGDRDRFEQDRLRRKIESAVEHLRMTALDEAAVERFEVARGMDDAALDQARTEILGT